MSKYYRLCGENRVIIIIDYVSPPRCDYVDNRLVFLGVKKKESPYLEDPPSKNLSPYILKASYHGNLRR